MDAKTLYRRFKVEVHEDGRSFDITELEPTDKHPMNWIDLTTTREGAWEAARAQDLPVVVRMLDGTTRALGVVFDPEAFERACYRGYVSYGHSMSDGYYAPLKFDSWVASFRRSPSLAHMDVAGCVAGSLDSYLVVAKMLADDLASGVAVPGENC